MIGMRRIYMDLDGPLLDVSRRYYEAHRLACVQAGIRSSLSAEEYWEEKRKGTALSLLLPGADDEAVARYRAIWRELVESDELLLLDRPHDFVFGALNYLCSWAKLWLVSLRRRGLAGRLQVDRLNLSRYFEQLIFTWREDRPGLAKSQAVKALESPPMGAFFVGDTEVDIEAARDLNIPIVAVLTGIRSEERLRSAGADRIVPDIRALNRGFPE